MEGSSRRWVVALALLVLAAGAALVLSPCGGGPTTPETGNSSAPQAQEPADRRASRRAERPAHADADANLNADAADDDADDLDADDASPSFVDSTETDESEAPIVVARIVVRSAADHSPLAGATVHSIVDDVLRRSREMTTGADGEANASMRPGGVRPIVRKRGFLPARIEHLPQTDDPSAEPTVVELTPAMPLEGRVVCEGGAKPLANATVIAWTGDYDKEFDDPVTTDADGRFEFVGVPADVVIHVSAVAPGFAPRTVDSAPTDARAWLQINLGDGASISGTVRDAAGRPVADAMVFVHDAREPPPLPRKDLAQHERFNLGYLTAHKALLVRRTLTGADGRWRVAGVPAPDAYIVYARRAVDAERDDEGRSPEVVLASNEHRDGVDIVVAAPASIHVTVLAPSGGPPPATRHRLSLDGPWHEASDELKQDLDDDGTTTFEHVLPGAHVVFIEPDGFMDAQARVEVRAGACAEVTIRLDRGAIVRGRILDDAGAPIPKDVYVQFNGTLREEDDVSVSGDVAADGTFEIAGVPPGVTGTVFANAKGYVGVERAGIAAGADAGTITLRRAARIVGVLPEALSGFVYVLGHHTYDGTRGGSSGGASRPANGAFAIEDLVPDVPMEVWVSVPGVVAPLVLSNVTLRAGETRDLGVLKFPEGVELRGVILGADGKPVRGAKVDCTESWASCAATTGADGTFRFENLVATTATFRVEAPGYPRTWVELVPGATPGPVTIRLARGGLLRGKLAIPVGTKLPLHTHVDAYPLDKDGRPIDWHYHEFEFDGLGAFEIRLPAGRYVLGLHRGRPATEPLTVDVAEGGESEVVLKLR